MMSQLNFLMSFIEDLIDLRQLHYGEFILSNSPFEM